MKTFAKYFALLLTVVSVPSFALDNSGNPGFYITQPFIGNGLLTSINASNAQANIGIDVNGSSNVVKNAVTNGDLRPVTLDNNFTNVSAGGSTVVNMDTDSGAPNGGMVSISANLNDIDTTDSHILFSATNAAPGGSQGHIDFVSDSTDFRAKSFFSLESDTYDGGIVTEISSQVGPLLSFSFRGRHYGNAFGLTNLQGSNIVGQIPLNALTNFGSLSVTNFGLLIGQLATNYVNTNAINLTNFVLATSNSLNNFVIGSTNVTPDTSTTNLFIAHVSQEGIYPAIIVLRGSSNSANNLVYSRIGTYWTNSGSGYSVFSNTVGGILRYNNRDTVGNVSFFKTNSPQGLWTANFITTNPPIGDWGRVSDFGPTGNASAYSINNLNLYYITNAVDGGGGSDMPIGTMASVYVYSNNTYQVARIDYGHTDGIIAGQDHSDVCGWVFYGTDDNTSGFPDPFALMVISGYGDARIRGSLDLDSGTIQMGDGNSDGNVNVLVGGVFVNGDIISTNGIFHGNGAGLTNVSVTYFTNITINVRQTNNAPSGLAMTWRVPVVVSEPATTLGFARIDAYVQQPGGSYISIGDASLEGGATSILQTNRETLAFDVPQGWGFVVSNSTAGTGYVASLDATKTNQLTLHP